MVANIEAFRDRTNVHLVGNTVRPVMASLAIPYAPISTTITCGGPQPAAVSFLNLRPKAFGYRNTIRCLLACLATVFCKAANNGIRRTSELATTLLADTKWPLFFASSVIARDTAKLALFAWLSVKGGTATDTNDGILGGHRNHPFGVTLPVVDATRGLCRVSIIPHPNAVFNYST